MKTVFEGRFLHAQIHEPTGGLWLLRRAVRGEPDEVLPELQQLQRIVGDPAGRRLVFDSRAVPGRNDEAFEGKIVPAFMASAAQFEAVLILMKTAVGQLQANRIGGPPNVAITRDEAEARTFLGLGPDDPLPM